MVQKEVEEEKQARVGQVSELLGWTKGLQDRAGRSTEPSLAAQQVKLEYQSIFRHYLDNSIVVCIC